MNDLFKAKCEIALAQIKTLDDFRASDPMVDYVFKVGRSLFDRPLDQLGEDWLVSTGGKLTGAYAYLSNKASYARAERDVYEQKLKEVESKLTTEYLDSDYKVTQTRAIIKTETVEISNLVIVKEHEKNNYENIMSACEKLISFIQSSLRMKHSEQFRGNMYNNS